MKKWKSLLFLLALTLPLQGCWFFFYIPGSVVNSVSDAVTGAEGSNCVGENAKVGDKIRLPNGSVGTIKSLSGTSVRCTEPGLPIRALLVFDDDNTATTESTHYASKLSFSLPAGWEQKELTASMVKVNTILYAINRTTDTGLLLFATKREGITDLTEFTYTRRASQADRLIDPQLSDISEIEIGGKKALRCEVTGTLKSGQKLTYMITVIEGSTEIAIVNAFTSAANFERQKEAMSHLAENVKGWSLQNSETLQKNTVDKNSAELKQKLMDKDFWASRLEKAKALCAKPEYAPLFVKSPCFPTDITFEQIADNTKITPEQKAIGLKCWTEVDALSKENIEVLRIHGDIQMADYFESILPEIDKYNLDLLNGVITWGEYNQRRKDLNARNMAEVRKINQAKH